jgi:predicted acetyltransferase
LAAKIGSFRTEVQRDFTFVRKLAISAAAGIRVRAGGRCGTNGPVAELSVPTVRVRQSFLAGMAEFQNEGRGGVADDTMIGSEIREFGQTWSVPDGFADYVRFLRDQALEDSPRPEGYVPSTSLWWVDGEEYLGRIGIRHRLTERLLEVGGHIGYDVRPSARRRGHATAMLAAALPVARELGIESALLTCDADNVGSRKVIEHNGGVLEDVRDDKMRFWVPTSFP